MQFPDVHSAFVLQATPLAFKADVSEASASPGTAVSAESGWTLVSAESAVPISTGAAVSAESAAPSGDVASMSSMFSYPEMPPMLAHPVTNVESPIPTSTGRSFAIRMPP
jgi:hypothetical protein